MRSSTRPPSGSPAPPQQAKTFSFAPELRAASQIAVGHTSSGGAMKALLFTGPFSDADIAELAETLRRIDQRAPDQHYNPAIADLDRQPSIEETVETSEKIFPRVPDRPVDWWMKPL